MFLKTCRCGKSKKNFKVDIGEFFINQCCRDAGYDSLGRKVGDEKPVETPVEMPQVVETTEEKPVEMPVVEETTEETPVEIPEEKPAKKTRRKRRTKKKD